MIREWFVHRLIYICWHYFCPYDSALKLSSNGFLNPHTWKARLCVKSIKVENKKLPPHLFTVRWNLVKVLKKKKVTLAATHLVNVGTRAARGYKSAAKQIQIIGNMSVNKVSKNSETISGNLRFTSETITLNSSLLKRTGSVLSGISSFSVGMGVHQCLNRQLTCVERLHQCS